MSFEAFDSVTKYSKAKANARWVLGLIARHADKDTYRAKIAVETIAEKSGIDRRNAFRILRRLADSGELEITSGMGRHRINEYKINLPKIEREAEEPERQTEEPARQGTGSRFPVETVREFVDELQRKRGNIRNVEAYVQKALKTGWCDEEIERSLKVSKAPDKVREQAIVKFFETGKLIGKEVLPFINEGRTPAPELLRPILDKIDGCEFALDKYFKTYLGNGIRASIPDEFGSKRELVAEYSDAIFELMEKGGATG